VIRRQNITSHRFGFSLRSFHGSDAPAFREWPVFPAVPLAPALSTEQSVMPAVMGTGHEVESTVVEERSDVAEFQLRVEHPTAG